MNLTNIVDGISHALFNEFGEEYEIYTEDIEQGLKEPCFFITCINPSSAKHLGGRYKRANHFVIEYFPSSDEKNNECNVVLEQLFDCLELIEVNGKLIRGTNMSGEFVNDILSFNVHYDLFIQKVEDKVTMDYHSVNYDVKG